MQDSNKDAIHFHKKLVIFGSESCGKTSLKKKLEKKPIPPKHEKAKALGLPQGVRISYDLSPGRVINANVFEYKIGDEEITENDKKLLETLLFQCQCAIFMVDAEKKESLDYIQKIIPYCNLESNIMTPILVVNKIDTSTDYMNREDIQSFSNQNKMPVVNISLKTDSGFTELADKICDALNDKKKILPINMIYEMPEKSQKNPDKLNQFKIILLGDSEVGKTSFSRRYRSSLFTFVYVATVGSQNDTKFYKIANETIRLTVWDTAGQERYQYLPKNFYQNADGIFLLIDVLNGQCLENIQKWVNSIKDNASKCPIVYLLGNKVDALGPDGKLLERKISKNDINELLKNLDGKYFETSCYLDLNINEIISQMLFELYAKNKGVKKEGLDGFGLGILNGDYAGEKSTKKCCGK